MAAPQNDNEAKTGSRDVYPVGFMAAFALGGVVCAGFLFVGDLTQTWAQALAAAGVAAALIGVVAVAAKSNAEASLAKASTRRARELRRAADGLLSTRRAAEELLTYTQEPAGGYHPTQRVHLWIEVDGSEKGRAVSSIGALQEALGFDETRKTIHALTRAGRQAAADELQSALDQAQGAVIDIRELTFRGVDLINTWPTEPPPESPAPTQQAEPS